MKLFSWLFIPNMQRYIGFCVLYLTTSLLVGHNTWYPWLQRRRVIIWLSVQRSQSMVCWLQGENIMEEGIAQESCYPFSTQKEKGGLRKGATPFKGKPKVTHCSNLTSRLFSPLISPLISMVPHNPVTFRSPTFEPMRLEGEILYINHKHNALMLRPQLLLSLLVV